MSPRELPPRARHGERDLDPEEFEAIREAVMETARGRWFLDEFATRLRQREAAGLSEGMKRLEALIAANHDDIMSRLTAALAEERTREPSEAPEPSHAEAAEPRLSPRHMKYYRADEDLFEPPPEGTFAALPRLVETAREAEVQPPRRRIVIIRHKPGEQLDVPLAEDFARAS